jgi:uncharacterized protein (TIGR03083 family)
MILAPRYEGPTILSIDGPPGDLLQPFTRQRRRMLAMLEAMSDQQWTVESRCDGWTAREVAAHLVTVNSFWHASIVAGLAGTPTRMLAGFDPAASPPVMVDWMSALSHRDVLDQFTATTDTLLNTVAELDEQGWVTSAEAPAGVIAIRALVQHALWDSWIHERDIAIPLGIATPAEPDEVRACLQFAAAISPALGIGLGLDPSCTLAVEAVDPHIQFVLHVGDAVRVFDRADPALPCLRGDAVELVEALTLRAPMPSSTPAEWSQLLAGLATAFDAVAI